MLRLKNNLPKNPIYIKAALFTFAALIPFQIPQVPITLALVLLLFFGLFSFEFTRFREKFLHNPQALIFVLFYLWMVAGLAYTPLPAEGDKNLVLKITFLLFPLFFALLPMLKSSTIRLTLFTFAFGVSLSNILSLGKAFFTYAKYGDVNAFFYDSLHISPFVSMHYMAWFNAFALMVFLFGDAQGWVRKAAPWGALLSAAMVLLLSVRIQFVAVPVTLLLIVFLLKIRFKRRHLRWGWVLPAILVLMLLLPGSKKRMIDTADEVKSMLEIETQKQTNQRVYLWKYGLEIVAENWLLGTGTGSASEAMHQKLLTCDARFWDGEKNVYLHENRYNYHNVYLQVFGTHGIVGFLFFMFLMVSAVALALKRKDAIALGFILLSAFVFITDSALERQAGVLFFAFFYGLFFVHRPQA